ncbi:TetR/AcrR family transcriptional regulator [Streptomyces mexicanus]|jgi:AcrR family transcriptional regulator|uniref:TetR/AcrR family transcriptional regulator n=1 Tax=Streptomyces mexicanus TaxID=178566 RepID=A0A7X1LPM6_9ACTN|nr:TetR/AcrR family transcriptional regulator [Streptomyces mexicanus]MBC2865043.1 TetR/AcrR family transcriptional regulator [Streptomyces mexicanus]
MAEAQSGPGRVRNRWGQGERLRGDILDAASRLLSEIGGEDALTIRGVARAAGIAPASIYQHFTDRAALVRGLLEHEFGRLREAMREADRAAPDDDPVARVRAQLRGYYTFAVENPGHYRLMINSGALRVEPLVEVITMVCTALERCEQSGLTLRLPARQSAVTLVVAVHGRVALQHSSARRQGTQALRTFVDDLLSLVIE